MFRGELLIDGYNLLHAAGLARRSYAPGEFERTRRRLIKLLAAQLSTRERRRTTVVFDAPAQSLGSSPPTDVEGIRVVFAGGDGDADAAIERLIRQSSAPRRLHVISSDHRLQRAARRRRAKALDSEGFLARIAARPTPDERARQAEPPEKREGLTSAGEVDAWMRAFADVVDEHSPDRSQKEQLRRTDDLDEVERQPEESGDSCPEQSGTDPAAPEDVSFWEQRIAELWSRTDDEAQ